MKQFDMPAVVPADPGANITDLLAARLAATPDSVLFSVPRGAGWAPVTTSEFHRQVVGLAKGSEQSAPFFGFSSAPLSQ